MHPDSVRRRLKKKRAPKKTRPKPNPYATHFLSAREFLSASHARFGESVWDTAIDVAIAKVRAMPSHPDRANTLRILRRLKSPNGRSTI